MKGAFSLIAQGASLALVVYIGFFFLWAMMFTACEEKYPKQCGDDLMSQAVKIFYKPVFATFVK